MYYHQSYHPERKEDEIFLGNFTLRQFLKVGYKTKRIGITPYDLNGKIIMEAILPVFCKKEEYIKYKILKIVKRKHTKQAPDPTKGFWEEGDEPWEYEDEIYVEKQTIETPENKKLFISKDKYGKYILKNKFEEIFALSGGLITYDNFEEAFKDCEKWNDIGI